MKILFIAPVPPPVTGQSLAVKILLDKLSVDNHSEVINLNKSSFKSGVNSLVRIVEIIKIVKNVFIKYRGKDLIYFTLAESFAGNMKDLLIYLVSYKLRRRTVVHMLGGAGMKRIVEKRGWQFKLNKFFISRLAGVVVEGEPQFKTFENYISRDKIHTVPNFAEDYLFLDETEVNNKFFVVTPVRILFLSNLIYGKGYKELVDAYISLDKESKDKVLITFVGGFESEKNKSEFLQSIADEDGLIYHGHFVTGNEKKKLYSESHVFCLPTYYPFEGQPISILEAYATGCVVITTSHSGIPYIFTDGINGYEVNKMSPESLKNAIEMIIQNLGQLLPIAVSNMKNARSKYRTAIYSNSIIKIFDSIYTKNQN